MEKIKIFWQNLFSDKIRLWKIATFSSIVLFLFLTTLIILFIVRNKQENSVLEKNTTAIEQEKSAEKKCADCSRRNLDGVFVPETEANPQPIAVMIDNHPSARPALGLEKASLIYEAEVEGHFTRYMAIFTSAVDYGEIGPVRSARPYFVSWAKEINAIYSHCGGSPEALVDLVKKDIVDLNEFYNGQYFWRADSPREAPHNVITSGANLEKFAATKNLLTRNFTSWIFKEDVSLDNRGEDGKKIKINYNHQNFLIGWRYNREDNNYARLLENKLQLTEENNLIVAKNIIIQTIPAKVIDNKLRLKMDTTGTGIAIICQDGRCETGEWKKEDLDSRTKFYLNNKEVEFNAGQTWIEVIRPEVEIEY
ncbi:MAG: DUF3048 domain-containing protein [Patescibacteria group bacterium]|jgi:hypothetical protein